MSDTVTTMSSREFSHDTGRAKRAAAKGPVLITTRGSVSHVLITKEAFDHYTRKPDSETPKPRNLAELLADNSPQGDFDFDIPEFMGVFKGFEFE